MPLGNRAGSTSHVPSPGSKFRSLDGIRTGVPPGIDDERFCPQASRVFDRRTHGVSSTPGAVREPGVVGDERYQRPPATDAIETYDRNAAVASGSAPRATPKMACGPSTGVRPDCGRHRCTGPRRAIPAALRLASSDQVRTTSARRKTRPASPSIANQGTVCSDDRFWAPNASVWPTATACCRNWNAVSGTSSFASP